RHERGHVADVTAHDDVDALHTDAAARARRAVDDDEAAVARRGRRLRCAARDVHGARHDVLGEARSSVAENLDSASLVHACSEVPDLPVDGDTDVPVNPDGNVVSTTGIPDPPLAAGSG